mmetsp:Transcript_22089/g.46058  ORF Transcript_22089/g.46058 Transcript_22089/m.46058 type:complete len:201 (-) Transcript_22089:586-1188(-)
MEMVQPTIHIFSVRAPPQRLNHPRGGPHRVQRCGQYPRDDEERLVHLRHHREPPCNTTTPLLRRIEARRALLQKILPHCTWPCRVLPRPPCGTIPGPFRPIVPRRNRVRNRGPIRPWLPRDRIGRLFQTRQRHRTHQCPRRDDRVPKFVPIRRRHPRPDRERATPLTTPHLGRCRVRRRGPTSSWWQFRAWPEQRVCCCY